MNVLLPTPYPELNAVLQELAAGAQGILGDNFTGAYLQGSFAVGDFDVHSDVDFIIVTKTEPSQDHVPALQIMHGRLYALASSWAQHLEGSYFPEEILRSPARRGEKLWYLDNGSRSLIKADHCNTVVVRWVVREKGVTLGGPPPDTLIEPMSVEMLRAEIMETITGWGQEIMDNPDRFRNRFYQTYIVLNFCRMLHDLLTGYPGSKRAGAEWAKTSLDSSWNGLIDRAWSGRPKPEISVRQAADPKDFESTLKFVQHVINQASRMRQAARSGMNPAA
ncbi:MAG TPA: aminoglycoside adenylyltransferase domain-containing protein [Anaerolineales bacterium]|nr:aminoglycoside adenylyltransferase domain-containing protein [Anaerolineales bacterium]